jgi:tetraacyldisaccharide 4'-kinase
LRVTHFDVPVIIVGNIVVGGTGKTPLVIWLTGLLKAQGYKPAVVCRGYLGQASSWPQLVHPSTDPRLVGDEAVLIAKRCEVPVAADPNRVRGVEYLTNQTDCDIIVSDDGMQHFALGRDIEIAVMDGERRHGNGRYLPAGPLREPVARLKNVDLVVSCGSACGVDFEMQLVAREIRDVRGTGIRRDVPSLKGSKVHAVCGIGNPGRFFTRLRDLGLDIQSHEFPDHHQFAPTDIDFKDDLPVLMTEKDAVKCRAFAGSQHWYLPVEATLSPGFGKRVLALLRKTSTD